MPRYATIHNQSKPYIPAIKTVYASSFLEKLRGLMFRKNLLESEGLILAENGASQINAAIHMFFMNFDIGVVWVNPSLIVIDKTLAKRWRPYYAPKLPAQYTLELHPIKLDLFAIGDQITFSIEE